MTLNRFLKVSFSFKEFNRRFQNIYRRSFPFFKYFVEAFRFEDSTVEAFHDSRLSIKILFLKLQQFFNIFLK